MKREAVLVPAALVLFGTTAVARVGAETVDESIQEVLVTGWGQRAWSDDKTVKELAMLGPKAVPKLFRIHAGQDFSPWEGEEARFSFERGPERGGELAGLALKRMSRGTVVSYLDRAVGIQDLQAVRLAAIGLYAAVGAEDELEPFLRLAGSFSEEELNAPTMRTRIPTELCSMFERVPEAALASVDSYEKVPQQLRRTLSQAFLSFEHPAAIDVLSRFLGREASFDKRAIARLSELGKSYPWALAEEESYLAASLLVDSDWRVRRAACVLAGSWRRIETFEELIRMREEDGQPSVRRAADWALKEISGTELQLDRNGWTRWLEAQLQAWDREIDTLSEGLYSEDLSVVAGVLRRCTQFPLHRDQFAPLVASVLYDHPTLVDSVAGVLITLDSRQAVPVLIDLLEVMEDDRARGVVWKALKHLTGRDLAIDDPAWAAIISG